MNKEHGQQSLGQLIEDYYAESPLPQTTLERLKSKKRQSSDLRRRWPVPGVLAAAAALVVLAFSGGYAARATASPTPGIEAAATTPSLVAVQIHADWCARSPVVAPIFADLLTQYGNEPVLFVTLDITDDVRRGQAELLAASLGIPQAFDKPFESGMIKLIDRNNNALLAAITGREQSAEFEVRLAELLGKDKHDHPESGT